MYLIRELNRRWIERGLTRRTIKRRIDDVIELGLRDRPDAGPRLRLQGDQLDRFTRWSARDARDLLDDGVRVVGAVADLVVRRDDDAVQASADDVARAGAFAVMRAIAAPSGTIGAGDG